MSLFCLPNRFSNLPVVSCSTQSLGRDMGQAWDNVLPSKGVLCVVFWLSSIYVKIAGFCICHLWVLACLQSQTPLPHADTVNESLPSTKYVIWMWVSSKGWRFSSFSSHAREWYQLRGFSERAGVATRSFCSYWRLIRLDRIEMNDSRKIFGEAGWADSVRRYWCNLL